MGKKKPKASKQSSPVTGSSKDQYGPDRKPDGSDSGDADSAVWSEASMPRDINFSGTQPHNERDDDSAVSSEDSMPRGADFSYTDQHDDGGDWAVWSEESMPRHIDFCDTQPHNSIRKGSCGVHVGNILGNIHYSVKHINRYCTSSAHEGRDGGPSSVFWRYAGIPWMLLIILSVLTASLLFHLFSKDPVELPELRVMMLGKTGAGKSASGNTILGREAFKSEASASSVTKSCDSQSGVVEGRNITVIDTPAITTGKAALLSEKVDPGPHVFLLVIPLGRFTEEDGEEVKWIQINFGEEALKFTIVLFTREDQMDHRNIEQFLKESSGLQTLVSSTSGGYHIFDNKTPRGHGQVKGLLEKIELLLRKNMGYSYSHGLHEQVKTAVREEEERKRRGREEKRRGREEEDERKRRGCGEFFLIS